MKLLVIFFLLLSSCQKCFCQNNSINYFLDAAQKHNPALLQNRNLQELGRYDNKLLTAQNNFQVEVTSDLMVAPYFDNYGKFIDISTNPSPKAYGYAEPVSNGALYSAQLNITREIFNRAKMQNLLFQNKLNNKSLLLSKGEIQHQLQKNVTDAYISVYHLQVKEELTRDMIAGLENRLKVVALLVKKGILMQSDYLLLQLEIQSRKLELQQTENSLNANLLSLYNFVGINAERPAKLLEPELIIASGIPAPADGIPTPAEVVNYGKNQLNFSKSQIPDFVKPTSTVSPDTSYAYQRKYKNDSLQLIAEQRVFEDKYKPQLIAYGSTGLNAVEVESIPYNFGFSVGLKLSVPIYDGGQRKIKQLQNKMKLDNLQYQKENNSIKIQNTLHGLEEQMASVKTAMDLMEAQLRKQQQILEIYKGKMVQGQVSVIDYLKVVDDYKMNLETRLQMKINLWLLENEYNATNW
ncbi:TolC family protein [Zunongwangia sp. H14]|uniref:TolC family protein n=1 Tax=Zunongwangia sp. H14 TaxID=3240792 RepID=UPI003563589A